MTSVGIRQLRDRLSKYLEFVRDGSTITVTDHGQPIARIIPVGAPSALDALIAEGVVQLPARSKRPAPDPVVADVSLSERLLDDRR